ncbi:hypothetical protein K458DRAFT_29329 [Lentithecium fluviatile CBS 122367]|uniref:Uncharacterized protein n=1 Tax=Lentithecium fluviatile CBS 122367 TaxID=1168545 RepID=A0A6G1J424_9PLEO|nr:hypothetical protein K458DRAFT_29329 [Lentithecium fluviatile CBS 122367]
MVYGRRRLPAAAGAIPLYKRPPAQYTAVIMTCYREPIGETRKTKETTPNRHPHQTGPPQMQK